MDIEDHVNPMEEYDTNNIVEEDKKNILIQDFFNAPMDESNNLDEDNLKDEDNDDEYIYDVPLLQRATQALYDGSKKYFLCYNGVGEFEGIEQCGNVGEHHNGKPWHDRLRKPSKCGRFWQPTMAYVH